MKTVLILFLFGMFACADPSGENSSPANSELPERVIVHYKEYPYGIIEVDSHQYLVNYYGGIYHLESCKCKNQ